MVLTQSLITVSILILNASPWQICCLVLVGVGIKQVSSVKQMLGKITSLDSNNYPEMLGKTCIINAPSGFGMIFGMVKPFLDARTRAKVEVGSPFLLVVHAQVQKKLLVGKHCA